MAAIVATKNIRIQDWNDVTWKLVSTTEKKKLKS